MSSQLDDPWRLLWDKSAARTFQSLEGRDQQRIGDAMDRLSVRYPEGDTKKLKGSRSEWRLRIGDWRVIFEPLPNQRVLRILRLARRDKAYS